MSNIIRHCALTKEAFAITDKDLSFYQMMDVAAPEICPDERQRKRLSWRNEINLYKRKCDLTGREIISLYSPDKPYKVFDHQEWYGDKWDALAYGRPFDFNRAFFEQFEELFLEVPKIGLIVLGDNENSEYTNDNYKLKNCYLVFDGEQGLDCMYGETFAIVKSCIDFLHLSESEFCYECVNCAKCYNVNFSSFCNNCSDSYFLMDCRGCRNCFGCCNLRQKQYCIGNKQYTKEEYESFISRVNLNSFKTVQKYLQESKVFFQTHPKRAMRGLQNENVTGDNIDNSKDSFFCFDCSGLRDCKFCTNMMMGGSDCHDIDIWGDNMQRCYDSACCGAGAENVIGSFYAALGVSNVFHSAYCYKNCHNIFGSTGLIQKQYCILNKKYSKEEYEALLPKIIEHLKKTGEWGKFFPIQMSQFGYNETVAQDHFPLTEEEAKSKGYKWKSKDLREFQKSDFEIPDNLDDVPDAIINELLSCESCGKNYKIAEKELRFYRQKSTALPRKCFNCRHSDRKKLRNPRHLYARQCFKCKAAIQTTYAPQRPETVCCEACYLEIIN